MGPGNVPAGANFSLSAQYFNTFVLEQVGLFDAHDNPIPQWTLTDLITTQPVFDQTGRLAAFGLWWPWGDEITIVAQHALADRLYVRLGTLEPIRVSPPGDGRVRIVLPDNQYLADLDHPLPRPIPPAEQLQPGPLEVQLIAMHPAEGVQGGLGQGAPDSGLRRYSSNTWLLQLCPRVTGATPAVGNAATILRVTGNRLWRPAAGSVDVIVGDAAIPVRIPGAGDPWAAPTPSAVEVHIAAAGTLLEISAVPYRVAVQVDGTRSRDPGVTFTLGP
jgi:hypothetical protein